MTFPLYGNRQGFEFLLPKSVVQNASNIVRLYLVNRSQNPPILAARRDVFIAALKQGVRGCAVNGGSETRAARECSACLCPSQAGDEHANLSSVLTVLVAVESHEIALFKLKSDQNVRGRHRREKQMPNAHRWRCPKCDNETSHDRMSNEAVDGPRLETDRHVGLVSEMQEHLAQPKELEVVNQKGRDENQ